MRFQSDFHRKKNFANPNLFNNSTAAEKPTSPQQSTPVSGRPDAKEETKEQEEVRTEHLFKHPLQNTWTLWYLENDRTKSWEDMQNEITSFDTVEDFWSVYNHIKPPSDIKLGSDYSLFKKGIRPMWEDAGNKQVGRWVITLNKTSKADLDNLWLDVLLCLIGEAFEHSDVVCGAVVNIRGKNNKISIWTANGNNEETKH
ncbi:eukaryotic translation initiation factor 4E1-like [Bactrocera neohumeralis]|uniref:eukaryotic translation initiation factor 4E1-like n=1 Tax=Bactrocera neohumeralis TaxID=98809 RepID=UPI002165BF5B|nr:eukaryotic translation initiation factor 4E1-like [Bactrocera neohumeralis]